VELFAVLATGSYKQVYLEGSVAIIKRMNMRLIKIKGALSLLPTAKCCVMKVLLY
jgi:hypothetical protein